MGSFVTLNINEPQSNSFDCGYADCRVIKCYAEGPFAGCCFTECLYAECCASCGYTKQLFLVHNEGKSQAVKIFAVLKILQQANTNIFALLRSDISTYVI